MLCDSALLESKMSWDNFIIVLKYNMRPRSPSGAWQFKTEEILSESSAKTL